MRPPLGECSNFRKRQHYYHYYKLNVKLLCHHILYIPTLSMSHSVFGHIFVIISCSQLVQVIPNVL